MKQNEIQEITQSCIDKYAKGWEELAQNIAILVQSTVFEEDDMCILIDGKEGAGKSLFLRKIGFFIQKLLEVWKINIPFDIDNIHFDSKDYIRASLEAREKNIRGHINILDEARSDLFRGGANTRIARNFTNYMSMIRDANQIHLLALPAFHDIDKNIFMWRIRVLIHIDKKHVKSTTSHTGYRLKRGIFKCYEKNNKLVQTYFSKIRYTYPKQYIFSGSFDKEDPIDKAAYNNKKKEKRKEQFIDDGGIKETKREITADPDSFMLP